MSAARYILTFFGILSLLLSLCSSAFASSNARLDSLQAVLVSMKEDNEAKVDLLSEISETLRMVNFDSSAAYCDRAAKIAENLNYEYGTANCFRVRGLSYYFIADFENAVSNWLLAVETFNEIGNKVREADVLNLLATATKKQGHNDAALEYMERALKISSEAGDASGVANALNNMGIVYENKEEYEKSLSLYQRSFEIKDSLQDKDGMTYNLNNIGSVLSKQGKHEEALRHFQRSLQMRLDMGNESGAAIGYINIAELYLGMENYDSTSAYAERCIAISTRINFNDLTQYSYNIMAQAQKGLGDYESAYHYHLLHTSLKDSLFTIENSRILSEMEAKYETGRQKQELAEKELKIKEQNLEISQKRNQLLMLLGGLVLLTLIGFLIYTVQRAKQKAILAETEKEQQEMRLKSIIEGEEKERKRLAVDLHDGLGQILSTVRLNVSSLEGDSKKEESEKAVSTALNLIDGGIDELREISHNLMPSALIKLGLVPALKEFTDKINTAGLIKVHLQTLDVKDKLENKVEIALYRVIQEIVNNALKYAEASELTLQLIHDTGNLTVMIEDNGVGFDKSKLDESEGIGWENIQSRVSFLLGELSVDSHPKRGTSVTIDLPI